jgi:hypothetical protein
MSARRPPAEAFAVSCTPAAFRTEYRIGTHGHRFVATARGRDVLADTGWQPTRTAAARTFAAALVPVMASAAARYELAAG